MHNFRKLFCICICLFARGAICIETTCDLDDNPNYAELSYLLIYRGNSTNFVLTKTPLSNPDGILDQFDSSKQSILYVHGFMQDSDVNDLKQVVKAYLGRGDVNVFVLDWSKLAENLHYFLTSKRVPGVGRATAQALNKIADRVNLETLHVIGHSLGAHVAAYIGRNVQTKLTRITGLDPAFPLFYPSECHLTPEDARMVVAVHTNSGVFGTPVNTGTVDVYVNNGIHQPNCPPIVQDMCSHKRSVELYAESIKNPKAFPVRKCNGAMLDEKDEFYLGDSVPMDARGTYCVFTTLD